MENRGEKVLQSIMLALVITMEAGLKDKKEESEKRTFVQNPVSATRVCVYFLFFLAGLFYFRHDSCFYLCQWRDIF